MGRDQRDDGDDTAGRGKKGRRGSKKLSGGGSKMIRGLKGDWSKSLYITDGEYIYEIKTGKIVDILKI